MHRKGALWIFQLHLSKLLLTAVINWCGQREIKISVEPSGGYWPDIMEFQGLCVSQRNSMGSPSQLPVWERNILILWVETVHYTHRQHKVSPRLVRFTLQSRKSVPPSLIALPVDAVQLVDPSFRAQTPCVEIHISTEFLQRLSSKDLSKMLSSLFYFPWATWTLGSVVVSKSLEEVQWTNVWSGNARNRRIWFSPQSDQLSHMKSILSEHQPAKLIYTLAIKHRYSAVKW